MKKGTFCFLTDQYYIDFPDKKIMKNKEMKNGVNHDRPCFFAFHDVKNKDILWLIPISSKVEKYKIHYDKKMKRFGKCNTIIFGSVAGSPSVFLIQNICPATTKYINNIYLDKNNYPVQIDNRTVDIVIKNAKKVLSDYFRGNNKIIFPNVKDIKHSLILQISAEKKAEIALDTNQKPVLENKNMKDRMKEAQVEANKRVTTKPIQSEFNEQRKKNKIAL